MCVWSPDVYYNFLLKCSVKIRACELEREIGVQRDSNYKINVEHCITFEHWPAGGKTLISSVLINKLEELKYFKHDVTKRSVRRTNKQTNKSKIKNPTNQKPQF